MAKSAYFVKLTPSLWCILLKLCSYVTDILKMCMWKFSDEKLFLIKGEFQICPRMDFDNILFVEYLRYNNYKNEIILFSEGC